MIQLSAFLTDQIVQVVNDHLCVVSGVHSALEERCPCAQFSFLQANKYEIYILI